jgi:hypothetical protein
MNCPTRRKSDFRPLAVRGQCPLRGTQYRAIAQTGGLTFRLIFLLRLAGNKFELCQCNDADDDHGGLTRHQYKAPI